MSLCSIVSWWYIRSLSGYQPIVAVCCSQPRKETSKFSTQWGVLGHWSWPQFQKQVLYCQVASSHDWSKPTDPKIASGETRDPRLEHVGRIQGFDVSDSFAGDIIWCFAILEIIGSFFADRDETEKNQRLATSETSKLQRYILWSFEKIQIKAFLLQKIQDKACPPDTTKWVLPPQKTVKNKNSKALTIPDFPQNRCSFFQFPRADPLDDSRWGPGTPTLTQTSGNVELQHKTSGTWKKSKHLSSLVTRPWGLSRKAAVHNGTHNRQRDTTPGPPLVLQTHRFGLERVSFHRSNLGCRWCAPSALQEIVTFPRLPGLWSSLPQQPLFVAKWPAHLEAVVPAFAALETAGQTQRFWFMIASQGRRSEGKQPVSLAKYDWRIFSMPTGIHPLSFPHKPCQSAPTKTLPLGILRPSMLARLGLHEKSLRMQCIYKYTKFHVYTQLLNIS